MQPDKQFNYWQDNQPSPVSVGTSFPPPNASPANPAVDTQPMPPVAAPVIQPQPQQIVQPVVQPSPAPAVQTVVPQPTQPVARTAVAPEPAPTTMYAPSEDEPSDQPEEPGTESNSDQADVAYDGEPIYWAATEYIYQQKGSGWLIVFIIIALGFIAADILFLKSYTFSALVAVMAVAMVVYNRRPPQEIDYTLSPEEGLYIGEVLHEFEEFKSFGVINDHGNNFIKLIPLKRFSMAVSVYFPNELGEQIVDILGSRLPMEEMKLDTFDAVVHKLRL